MGVVEGIVAGIARAETRLGVVVFAAVGALLALDQASTCRESRDQQQRQPGRWRAGETGARGRFRAVQCIEKRSRKGKRNREGGQGGGGGGGRGIREVKMTRMEIASARADDRGRMGALT